MAEDQKLKPNPDGLNFHEAVGNPGHSNMYITHWQSNYFILHIVCHPQHLLAMLDLQEKQLSVL